LSPPPCPSNTMVVSSPPSLFSGLTNRRDTHHGQSWLDFCHSDQLRELCLHSLLVEYSVEESDLVGDLRIYGDNCRTQGDFERAIMSFIGNETKWKMNNDLRRNWVHSKTLQANLYSWCAGCLWIQGVIFEYRVSLFFNISRSSWWGWSLINAVTQNAGEKKMMWLTTGW